MKASVQFVALYKKLKYRYPGKWYEGYHQAILSNVYELYSDFFIQYEQAAKILSNQHQRRKRIRKYVRCMIEHRGYHIPCLVSLTFTDECLSSTSFDTRKKYVRDYLNSFYPDWFACVDYGKKNGREHYHAICLYPFDKGFSTFTKKRRVFMVPSNCAYDWSYGFYSIRPLEVDPQDIYKTLNYAFKCSSYAFKASDNSVKPFHKRNGFVELSDDSLLGI